MKYPLYSKKIETSIDQSLDIFRKIIDYRDDRLFTEFLPRGYHCTTLYSVDECFYDQAMIAKFHLGMLITLLDDFADHPQHFNPLLLQEIYKIPFDCHNVKRDILNEKEQSILNLAEYLSNKILENIKIMPHFENLKNIFKFDLLRFYQANHFSELMTSHAEIINTDELLQLRPFNMGMVIAGMIDVIASSQFNLSELGAARRVFHLGQRFGSICNNFNTLSRELIESDITNEILVKGIERHLISLSDISQLTEKEISKKLSGIIIEMKTEQKNILKKLLQLKNEIHSFPCEQYVLGLKKLKSLHEAMQGVI